MARPAPQSPSSAALAPQEHRGVLEWLPLLLLLALAFLLGCFQLADYDIWWHLRTGQLIPERGVPLKDWYSFTSPDRDWIDVHWGFQLVIAWIHARFGMPGLVLMKATVGTLAVALALSAYRRHWSTGLQVVVWLPALLLMSSRFYVRPEIFTLLFTAIYLTVLFHAEEKPYLLWILPLVQAVWANFQGLFAFGPILLGMYIAEAVLRMSKNHGLFRHLMPVTVLVAVACMASPYRLQNALFVLELWGKMRPGEDLFRETIAELQDFWSFWQRGGFDNLYARILVGLLALAAVSLGVGWRGIVLERRVFRLLPLLAFGWLATRAVRNGNHFALVAGTVICWNLASVEWRWRSTRARRAGHLILSLGLVAFFGFVLSERWYLLIGGTRRLGLREQQPFISHDAMRLAGAPGMPERAAIINMGHAAAYIYHNGPHKKVLMDGRLEVHSESAFRDYLALEDAINPVAKLAGDGTPLPKPDWDAVLQSRETPVLMIDGEHNHALQSTVFAHPLWRCLYYDEVMALFLRKSVAVPPGLAEFDFADALFATPLRLFEAPLPKPAPRPTWWLFAPETIFEAKDDLASERAYYLALGLAEQPTASRRLRQGSVWYALQAGVRSIQRRPWAAETYRFVGAQWLHVTQLADPSRRMPKASEPWEIARGLSLAAAGQSLRFALACDPQDYSATLYLKELCQLVGADDEALALARKLVELRRNNVARMTMATALQRQVEELEARVSKARMEVETADLTYAGLARHANAGLLRTGLDRVDVAVAAQLPWEQVDRVGTWYLLVGEAEAARRVYEAGGTGAPAGALALRRGICRFALGEYAEARREFQSALEAGGEKAEAGFALVCLNLLAGERQQAASYLALALEARPSPPLSVALQGLAELIAPRAAPEP